MNSATNALVMKKPPNNINKRVGLWCMIAFNIDKNYTVEITSDNGKYKVMGENPDNFPKDPVADDTNSFTVVSSALVTAINKTLFAVSNDDLRPAMTGVFFEMDKKGLQFVATDAPQTGALQTQRCKLPEKWIAHRSQKTADLVKSSYAG